MFINSFRSKLNRGIGNPWLNRVRFFPSFLFAASEQGVWYDPSDLTKLFQDVNALTPITTAGQTVGLMLDKSKGSTFGADIAVNGNFSNGPTGWILGVGVTVSGGVASLAAGSGYLEQLVPTTAGRAYRVTATATGVSGVFCGAWDNANQIGLLNLLSGGGSASGRSGTFTFTFMASDTTSYVAFTGGGGLAATIDNVSVIPLPLGNHATQATSAQRPTYGFHPITGLRNLLLQSNTFNVTWNQSANMTITPAATVSPDGNTNGWLWTRTATSAVYFQQSTSKAASPITYTASFYVKKSVGDYCALRMQGTYPSRADVIFNLATGTISTAASVSTNFTTPSASIQNAGNGWYRVSLTATSDTATNISPVISFNSNNVQIDGTDSASNSAGFIYGAQLEVGATATAYQTVTTKYNITEAGVASAYYLAFDGVDDGMVTNTITPNTDKVQIFAGIRKLSDTTTFAIVSEYGNLSISPIGTAALYAPGLSAGRYSASSRGTVTQDANSSAAYTGPDTAVLTMQAEISTDLLDLRRNGTQIAASSSNQGAGNYLANPLFIGLRSGNIQRFNGNLYSLIVRFGPNLTTGQITSTETWVNGKTGAY